MTKSKVTDSELYSLANDARNAAYCPYSGVAVGAALLTASGRIYTGANIENSAFTPGVCAERVAIFKAISEGERSFLKIAVAGGRKDGVARASFYPCGVCRQVMAEFCRENFEILLAKGEKIAFSELLPYKFDKDSLE